MMQELESEKRTGRVPAGLSFCGRTFQPEELELMRTVAQDYAGLAVTEIARTVCELLEWKRANGRLKDQECRQLLEKMQEQGWLRLPTVRVQGPRGPRHIQLTKASAPQALLEGQPGEFEPLQWQRVQSREENRLWTELVERHHYLGFRVPVGAQLRYVVRSGQGEHPVLACLLWSSPAWKMAPRDRWIGWNPQQRARNLQFIVNQSRFLILPWVLSKGLASKILAQGAAHLPADWECSYGYRPLLLETLVESARFRGTCYRAANWIRVGQTQGRGRMDRQHRTEGLIRKDIYLYPLCRNVQDRLIQDLSITNINASSPLLP
jgi:Domain of unknown function (DUF4338)